MDTEKIWACIDALEELDKDTEFLHSLLKWEGELTPRQKEALDNIYYSFEVDNRY